jgi:hypothetical protein
MLPPTWPCLPPSSTWTWIASINIIDVFHLGLLHLRSYHHIPYSLKVVVQWTLHIPLHQLAFDPFDIVAWHFFCYSFLSVVLHRVVRKATKRLTFTCVNTWVVTGIPYKRRTYIIRMLVLISCRCLKSTPNPTPPPLTQLHRALTLAHVGEYVRTICALILNTHVAPFEETTHYYKMHIHSLWVSLDFEWIWTFLPSEIV